MCFDGDDVDRGDGGDHRRGEGGVGGERGVNRAGGRAHGVQGEKGQRRVDADDGLGFRPKIVT